MIKKAKIAWHIFRQLGLVSTLRYAGQRARFMMSRSSARLVFRNKYAAHSLKLRSGSSDFFTFHQIFATREYRCLDGVVNPGLIVDCGANVGCSCAYFLTRFPSATLIAVEPDPGNFAMLEANLLPYQGRYRAIRSAIWSRPAGLVISPEAYGDGREWSHQVRAAAAGETATIQAVDIGTLLRESGFERISILKIDVERSEAVVFSSNCDEWIGKVDNIVIELHDEECRSIFLRAIASRDFVVTRCDELTIAKRVTHGFPSYSGALGAA